MTINQKINCIHCGRGEDQVPLVIFFYKGGEYRICIEHFPILIHRPLELDGKLPDMDKLNPIEHD
jgi:hypothetical protein